MGVILISDWHYGSAASERVVRQAIDPTSMMSTGSEFVTTRVDMAPPSGSRPRVQSVTVCSPISDGGGDLQLPKTSPGPEHIPTKWSRPSNLVLPSHVAQPVSPLLSLF